MDSTSGCNMQSSNENSDTVAASMDHPQQQLRSIFNFDQSTNNKPSPGHELRLRLLQDGQFTCGDNHDDMANSDLTSENWQLPSTSSSNLTQASQQGDNSCNNKSLERNSNETQNGGGSSTSNWPSVPPSESAWTVPGSGRLGTPSLDEFWKEMPPPTSASTSNHTPYSTIHDSMSNLHLAGGEGPYSSMGHFYQTPNTYGNNGLNQWRDSGYSIGGGGFWRRGTYGNITDTGLSRESSRDDLTSMGDFNFECEDRFRVDRRKLELLIMGRFDPIKETAGEFFQRVGDETNTTVIWPSRIKIGARLKKDDLVPPDPHVRVGGTSEEAVRAAKTFILEFLDTKTTRVTMKMDVSYTDHSHIIGKGGNTIRRVMSETNCHVHFPDSNRSNPNEKSNQVSIAGEMEGVEKARARVRELTPLIFCFDLPLMPTFDAIPDINDPYVRAIQDQYNVQVTVRQKQKNFHTTIVVVKGCEWEAARVKEATLQLIEHFCYTGNSGGGLVGSAGSGSSCGSGSAASLPVSMNMEISPVHHSVVLGKANINLKIIMQRTKTTILFPDASDPNIPPIRKGSVTITGIINNVYLARQLLVGSLPLVMMFDLPDHIEIEDADVAKIQDELDVGISIKPKQRQSNKSVMIKAQERNASGMYAARHKILGLDGECIKADIPETYKLQAVSAQFLSSLSDLPSFPRQVNPMMAHSSLSQNFFPSYQNIPPVLLQNWAAAAAAAANYPAAGAAGGLANFGGMGQSLPPQFQNYLFPNGSASLYGSALGPKPAFDPTSGLVNPFLNAAATNPGLGPSNAWMGGYPNVLPPNHPFLQEYAMRVLTHITHLQQLETQHKNDLAVASVAAAGKGILDTINNNGGYLPVDDSPPMKGSSPRNSSPVHENIGNLTNQLSKLDDLNETEKFFELNQNIGGGISLTSAGNMALLRTSLGSSGISSCGSSITSSQQPQQLILPHQAMKTSVSSPTSASSATFLDLCNNNGKRANIDCDDSVYNQLCDWRRAPGSEKASSKSDYEDKKMLATKAVLTKPNGEPRTPTPSWSGLGFSNSMPEAIIRENLEVSDLESPSAVADGGNSSKRQNLAVFTNLVNVREEEEMEELPASAGSSAAKAPSSEVTSPALSTDQQFFRPSWFSNSSAFDVMLPASVSESDQNRVLSSDDLPSLFGRQGLTKYTDIFLRHEVDLATFATLTEQDLKEIGIQTFGARKKLLLLANKVKAAGSHQW